MRNRNNTNIIKTLKDYAVPLIGLFLILILIFNVFSGNDSNKEEKTNPNIENDNLVGVKIELGSENTKAFIIYKNGKKVEITDSINFSMGEKLNVEEGNVNILAPLKLKINLGKNGEIEYKDDGSFAIESGNAWVEAINDIKIKMKYADVFLGSSAIANLSQNIVESAIYNIDGKVKVSTNYGLEKSLEPGKKVVIKAKDTKKSDFDFKNAITDIDLYFKNSDWFKSNGGDLIIIDNKTATGTLQKTFKNQKITDIVSFDSLIDESYAKENPLNISGRYDTEKIGKITINNNEAKLNAKLGTFSYKINLENSINDIIIKIYDNNGDLLSKKVFTIYFNNPGNKAISNLKIKSKIENYKVDPTNFIIYEPTKTGKFSTTSSQVTIRGKVLDPNVKAVLVNDYKLKSYNGKTWRYHAFVEQGTLKEGTNLYEIKYLGKDNKVLYKEYYTIYKKIVSAKKDIKKDSKKKITKKISDEVKIKKD